MAQHHGVEAADVERDRLPVALAVQFQALEQSAVEQDARAGELDQCLEPVTPSAAPWLVSLIILRGPGSAIAPIR